MPIKIYDSTQGAMRNAAPRVYRSYWHEAAAWVFSNGAWRRTYDPTDENLLTNSRMMNGTDYYTFTDGTALGAPPPGWTWFNNTPAGQSNAYAYYSSNEKEYSRSYTFNATGSRIFMTTRLSVSAGSQYTATVYVDKISVQAGHKVANLTVDAVPATEFANYINITNDFPAMGHIKAGDRIKCQFTVLQDCILSFNIGIGVDFNDNGEVQLQKPMISKSINALTYQPTPKNIIYNAVELKGSYFIPEKRIATANGTHRYEMSCIIGDNVNRYLTLISRIQGSLTDTIAIDTQMNRLVVMSNGQVSYSADAIRAIPRNQIIGLGIWFDISGGYVTNLRLHLNGQLIALLDQRTMSMANIDYFLGSPNDKTTGLIVEQFAAYSSNRTYTFNLEEGSGNQVSSIGTKLNATIFGTEGTDFDWFISVPTITIQPKPIYAAGAGDTIYIKTAATDWAVVEWRNQHGLIINGNSDPTTLKLDITPEFDFNQVFYAVYKSRFGSMSTDRFRLVDNSIVGLIILEAEDGSMLSTEDLKIIVSEDSV